MSLGIFLRFESDLDGNTWAGEEVEVTVGVDTETWEFDTEIGGTSASMYDFATSLESWFNDAGRAWTGAASLSWAVSTRSDGQVRITFTSTASCTLTITAGLATFTGMTTPHTGTSHVTRGTYGSCCARFAVSHWQRHDTATGGTSSSGSWTMGQQAVAPRRPTVEAVLDEAQHMALTDALRIASSPRTAHIYQTYPAGWREVHLGPVQVSRAGRVLYRATLEVLG